VFFSEHSVVYKKILILVTKQYNMVASYAVKVIRFSGTFLQDGPDYPRPPGYVGIKATHRIFAANLLTSVLETIRKVPLAQAYIRKTRNTFCVTRLSVPLPKFCEKLLKN